MRLLLQLVDLALRRRAADEQQRADRPAGILREVGALALNLDRQLVGRRDHHNLRRLALHIEAAEDRQQVGQRLARAGLGVQIGVAAPEQHRQCRDLNGRGLGDALLG